MNYPKAKRYSAGQMKTQGKYSLGFPKGALVHFTAGRGNPVNSVAGGVKDGYCFFVIGPDGSVYQAFDLSRWGYHAGKSYHPRLGSYVHREIVGIEVCCAGMVKQIDSDTYRPWFNTAAKASDDFTRDQVRFSSGKQNQEKGWYHSYTPQQEASLIDLILWMKELKPDIFDLDLVVGHDEVSPGRKNDPGASLSMTMPDFRKLLKEKYSQKQGGVAIPVALPVEESELDDIDSSEDKTNATPVAKKALHFGRIGLNGTFQTLNGEFFLSASRANDGTLPLKTPFGKAQELEGQFAAIEGIVEKNAILESRLEEIVPPLTSSILGRLIESETGVAQRLLGLAERAHAELTGIEELSDNDADDIIKPGLSRPLCVLDIGHQPSSPGSVGTHNGQVISEYAFNKALASRIEALINSAEVLVLSRDDDEDGYKKLPEKINSYNPDFVVSLHTNPDGDGASGSSVLYFDGSTRGKKLAGLLQKEFVTALGLRDNGIEGRGTGAIGGGQLSRTRAPIVIAEPFHMTNPGDLKVAMDHLSDLANAYARAINTYASSLSDNQATIVANSAAPSVIEPTTHFTLTAQGLTKDTFLKQNEAALVNIIALVNKKLEQSYGAGYKTLTTKDAWTIFYCEAGLKPNGQVDPDHTHSAGERGLLPLPSNVKYWNGAGSPAWDKPMPLATNIEQFFLYLGNMKNKEVTTAKGMKIYRDLFTKPGIAGDSRKEARLLAAVTHGYFYSGTYKDKSVPFDHLIQGFANNTPLPQLMSSTSYVYAGTKIIVGRAANIDFGLSIAP
ncbi:hypothetical protein DB346_08065 [Verrucomicrobia bacterium LW23]|nr:hypothetical protein DB346_08065 [Verrucomicrobia bacterium LW23]